MWWGLLCAYVNHTPSETKLVNSPFQWIHCSWCGWLISLFVRLLYPTPPPTSVKRKKSVNQDTHSRAAGCCVYLHKPALTKRTISTGHPQESAPACAAGQE